MYKRTYIHTIQGSRAHPLGQKIHAIPCISYSGYMLAFGYRPVYVCVYVCMYVRACICVCTFVLMCKCSVSASPGRCDMLAFRYGPVYVCVYVCALYVYVYVSLY